MVFGNFLCIFDLLIHRYVVPKAASSLLKQRQQARVEKNYKLSDDLRQQLKDLGVEVEDTSTGQQAMNIKL